MSKIFYFLGHEQFQPEELIKHAILAEKAGFDGVSVSEHFNPWVADVGKAGFALSTLGALGVATKKLQLMTEVITPLFRYHPAVVAQAAATIDRLSNGRFMLGVGTGEAINEAPLGFAYPGYKERSERMKEALEILKKLLSGEKINFQGKYYTADAKLYTEPIHPVPVLLAAVGPKSATLAAESADGVITSVKNIEETRERVTDPIRRANPPKNFITVAARWTIFAQNDEEALEALQAWRGLRAPNRGTATDPEELQKEADNLDKNEILSRYTIVSSAEDYLKAYQPLINELNADIISIHTTGSNQQEIIQFLGEKVLPQLK